MRTKTSATTILLALGIATLLAGAWLPGCANDPFDPNSVENHRPIAQLFVSAAQVDTLNPTSYYERTFSWSGTDVDGFVVLYYVSIQKGDETPLWTETTGTDTTMTFATDDEGLAEATIRLTCQDNRGALSDTVTLYVPLRNFPPVIGFQRTFDPEPWSFNAAVFRLFAMDPDGIQTMDTFYRYKLDTADDGLVYPSGDPDADPSLGWVEVDFPSPDLTDFQIELRNIPSGLRTLSVTVGDEADADALLEYEWTVRPAAGPVLIVKDSGASNAEELYTGFMDEIYGPNDEEAGLFNWSRYEILEGLPDQEWILTETFRQFEVLVWYTGNTASGNLAQAMPSLLTYLAPDTIAEPDAVPGKLLMISPSVAGSAYAGNIPPSFAEVTLGIDFTLAPVQQFTVDAGYTAVAADTSGIAGFDLTSTSNWATTLGVTPIDPLISEVLYQLEFCRTCYSNRPPFEPYIGVRKPRRTPETPLADTVVLTTQLERYDYDQVKAALRAILENELLGYALPGGTP